LPVALRGAQEERSEAVHGSLSEGRRGALFPQLGVRIHKRRAPGEDPGALRFSSEQWLSG